MFIIEIGFMSLKIPKKFKCMGLFTELHSTGQDEMI